MTETVLTKAERIIIALDLPGYDSAAAMVENLGDDVSYYKVGFEMFIRDGEKILSMLKSAGKNVFLDLKLHDIPNTVKKSVEAICGKGVGLTTLHAMGGFEMMSAAAAARDASSDGVKLLGVTVLTSMSENALRDDLKVSESLPRMVKGLASVAQRAGLNGVVASAQELPILRETFSEEFLIVTPGIRPAWAATGDQKRIVTPGKAFDMGASFLVIGRPVTEDKNPREAIQRIHDEL